MRRRYSKTYFENPYLQDSERRLSSAVIMDEARQKWRAGHWRAKPEDFELEREKLVIEAMGGEEAAAAARAAAEPTDITRPEPKATDTPDRFKLDIARDLTGGTISVASLRELTYTPAYRPKGNLDEISEYAVAPMSTMSRYDVLAGDLEVPPEDVSFISDAEHRRARSAERGELRDGKLRLDTRRLETSVDERRSKLMSLLPAEDEGQLAEIVRESKQRRLIEDIELGKVSRRPKEETDAVPKHKPKIVAPYDHHDPMETYYARTDGSRFDRLPEQSGMGENTQQLPEFESETRRWSEIDSVNPTWSEIAAHSSSNAPKDAEPPADHTPRFVHDDLYNPNRPYEDPEGHGPRRRVRSEEAGEFNNEYLKEEGVDPEHIREIMQKKYRGRWIPPEFFRDNELVSQWFNQYNRGASDGEDFVHWAYRQKMMAEQTRQAAIRAQKNARIAQQQAAAVAEQQRRAAIDARRRRQEEQQRRREDERSRYEQARARGFSSGSDLRRRERYEYEREREREEYERRRERERAREYALDYGGYDYDYGYGAPPRGYYDDRYDDRRNDRRYQGNYPDLFDDDFDE